MLGMAYKEPVLLKCIKYEYLDKCYYICIRHHYVFKSSFREPPLNMCTTVSEDSFDLLSEVEKWYEEPCSEDPWDYSVGELTSLIEPPIEICQYGNEYSFNLLLEVEKWYEEPQTGDFSIYESDCNIRSKRCLLNQFEMLSSTPNIISLGELDDLDDSCLPSSVHCSTLNDIETPDLELENIRFTTNYIKDFSHYLDDDNCLIKTLSDTHSSNFSLSLESLHLLDVEKDSHVHESNYSSNSLLCTYDILQLSPFSTQYSPLFGSKFRKHSLFNSDAESSTNTNISMENKGNVPKPFSLSKFEMYI